MISLSSLTLAVLLFSLVLTLSLVIADYSKKRIPKKKPFASFISSCYNDGHNIEKTIKSVFDSYQTNFEMIITNDCSTDNSLEILKSLQKQYPFKLINNTTNLGKHKSINNAFNQSNGELIFIIDSDVIVNKPAIDEMLSRLEDPKMGAVSCRYKPMNKGILAEMASIECGMMSAFQTANNPISTFTMWGGCSGMKREAFEKVGGLTETAVMDDMDVALKIARSGWKVNECSKSVRAETPTKFYDWAKRKIVVMTGTTENYINHAAFFLTHPIFIIFTLCYAFLTTVFVYTLIHSAFTITSFHGINAAQLFLGFLIYPLLSSHCLIINENIKKKPYKLLLIYPFGILYFPFTFIFIFIGVVKGVYRVVSKRKERVW